MPFPRCKDARAENGSETDAASRLSDLRTFLAEIAEPGGTEPVATGLPGELVHALSIWRPALAHRSATA